MKYFVIGFLCILVSIGIAVYLEVNLYNDKWYALPLVFVIVGGVFKEIGFLKSRI